MPISLDVNVDEDELATAIAKSLYPEQVVELIKSIDLEVAEWDFTTTVASYFHEELRKLID